MRRAAVAAVALGGLAAAHAAPVLTNVPWLRKRAFPALAGIGDPAHLALTFDDGPDHASTPHFLDELDRLGVRATFFMLGEMVDRAPALAQDVHDAGHEVAVHGYRHRSHTERTPGAVLDDVARAYDTIAAATGTRPRRYRPPYGNIAWATLAAARRHDMRIVLWSTWGRDWRAEATPDTVVDDVTKGLGPGGTILLHDSDCTSAPGAWKSALGALAPILDRVTSMGLTAGPLADHWSP